MLKRACFKSAGLQFESPRTSRRHIFAGSLELRSSSTPSELMYVVALPRTALRLFEVTQFERLLPSTMYHPNR
jgi:hypothetical protein